MRKKLCLFQVMILACLMLLYCGKVNKDGEQITASMFMDKSWFRETEIDSENLYFSSDGMYSYYYGCGDSIFDADLCEGYTYDEKTHIITLKYSEKTENMISSITVKSCTDNTLVLDFNGETREFEAYEEAQEILDATENE